jgi:predicted nucleotidyltransferase
MITTLVILSGLCDAMSFQYEKPPRKVYYWTAIPGLEALPELDGEEEDYPRSITFSKFLLSAVSFRNQTISGSIEIVYYNSPSDAMNDIYKSDSPSLSFYKAIAKESGKWYGMRGGWNNFFNRYDRLGAMAQIVYKEHYEIIISFDENQARAIPKESVLGYLKNIENYTKGVIDSARLIERETGKGGPGIEEALIAAILTSLILLIWSVLNKFGTILDSPEGLFKTSKTPTPPDNLYVIKQPPTGSVAPTDITYDLDLPTQQVTIEDMKKGGKQFINIVTAFTPYVNDGRDFYEAFHGRDMITQEKLTRFERSLSFIGLIIASGTVFRKFLKYLFKYGDDVIDVVKKSEKLIDAADGAADAARTSEKVSDGAKMIDEIIQSKNIKGVTKGQAQLIRKELPRIPGLRHSAAMGSRVKKGAKIYRYSDVDILCVVENPFSSKVINAVSGVENRLSKALGKKVNITFIDPIRYFKDWLDKVDIKSIK